MKPTELLLSVIVPVYNREKTLSATVESILACPDKRLELVLVNDGSKDNSLALCHAFAKQDDRVKVIDKENGGVSSARNAGIEEAKGKYLFFCDGDDLVVTETLASALDSADMHNEDLLVFDFQYHFLNSNATKRSGFKLPEGHTFQKNDIVALMIEPLVTKEGTDFASSCTKWFRTCTVNATGIRFEEKVAKGEDWRFILDFLDAAETAFYFPKLLYTYNLDGSQVSSKYHRIPGLHQLGSQKRRIRLIQKYALQVTPQKLYGLYCSLIAEVASATRAELDKTELRAMFEDEDVQKATSAILSLDRNTRVQYGVLRRYRMMAFAIQKQSRLLLLFTIKLKNLFCRIRRKR